MVNLYLGRAENCPEGFIHAGNAFWMMHLLDVYRGDINIVHLADAESGNGLNTRHVVEYIVRKNRWSEYIVLDVEDGNLKNELYEFLRKRKYSWVKLCVGTGSNNRKGEIEE